MTHAAQPTQPNIRVGYITPLWTLGGVDRGINTIVTTGEQFGLTCGGIAISSVRLFDHTSARKIAPFCKLHCPIEDGIDQAAFPTVTFAATRQAALQAVIDRSDIVYVRGFTKVPDALRAVDLGGRPVIVPAHGSGQFTRDEIAALAPIGTHFMTVSQIGFEAFPEHLRSTVRLRYNGVDFNRCAPVTPRDEVRKAWGFEPHHRLIGYVGRLAYDKNPTAAALAAAELGRDYRAVYVGEGYQETEVKKDIYNISGDRASFVGRIEQIGDALAALDVFLLASPSEGCPQALIEAWVAERPVVATRVGIIPELEQRFGQLVVPVPNPPTPRELAEGIQLAEGDANRETIVRARRVAWQQFSANRMVETFSRIVREAVYG